MSKELVIRFCDNRKEKPFPFVLEGILKKEYEDIRKNCVSYGYYVLFFN